jgi:hypothetical protein
MNHEYISGYLEAISRVKDILTPHVGGTNQFFEIPKDIQKTLRENIQKYISEYKDWYTNYKYPYQEILDKIQLHEIENWKERLGALISIWTCDSILEKIHGKNGYHLSEYLVDFLLNRFFEGKDVKVFKMLPDWGDWHWGDHMSEEYVFETDTQIFIMHFGESS